MEQKTILIIDFFKITFFKTFKKNFYFILINKPVWFSQ